MKKKLFLALIIATLFVCIFAVSVSAVEIGGLHYNLSSSNGKNTASLTSGNQKCELTNVVIPETVVYNEITYTVTAMDVNAFQYNTTIQSVSIPKTIVFNSGYLFRGCSNLSSVTIDKDNKSTFIPAQAFIDTAITTVVIPEAILSINDSAFKGCKYLTSIQLPKNLTTIGNSAFQNCTALTSVKIPEKVTQIGHNVLHGCSGLTELVIPKGCTVYGQYSFNQNGSKITVKYTGVEGDDGHTSFKKYLSKATYVFVNHCDAYYNGAHNIESEEGNECCGICSRCGNLEMLEIPKHNGEWIFNGGEDVSFVAEITAEHVCQWCKTVVNAETIAIIVSTDGYSTEDNGTGVYQLTKINKAALSRYAELSEQTFDYGIFAGIAAEDEGTPLTLDENGIATAVDTKNTVFASFEGTQYTYLQIKVTGLDKDASIYCGAYLVIGENIIYLADKKVGTTVSKFVPTIA